VQAPGSGGTTAASNHYAQDAQTFADWGVDFVKIDECGGLPSGTTSSSLTTAFQQYGADRKADNPSVVYSEELPIYVLGQSSFDTAVQSSATFASMWRVAAGEDPDDSASTTIPGHLAADLHLHAFAGLGHWNDLDMLVPGTPAAHPFGWSLAGEQSQLSVWAEEASPLLISTNLTTLTSASPSHSPPGRPKPWSSSPPAAERQPGPKPAPDARPFPSRPAGLARRSLSGAHRPESEELDHEAAHPCHHPCGR
jgi:alpha-galactosidase